MEFMGAELLFYIKQTPKQKKENMVLKVKP